MNGQNPHQQQNYSNVPLPQANIGFSGVLSRKPRWDDNVPWYDIPADGQWHAMRFYGPIHMIACHWIKTKTNKSFPMFCLNYESKTSDYTGTGCPVESDFDYKNHPEELIKNLQPRQNGLVHAVIRDIQRVPNPDPNWKPWRPMRLPMGIIISLQKLRGLNKCDINGIIYEADVSDPYWGIDVYILYDPANKNPNQRYSTAPGPRTPLTDMERMYLNEMYNWPTMIQHPTKEEIKQALVQNGYYQLLNGGIDTQTATQNAVLPQMPLPQNQNVSVINPVATQPSAPQPMTPPIPPNMQPPMQQMMQPPMQPIPQPMQQPMMQQPMPQPMMQYPGGPAGPANQNMPIVGPSGPIQSPIQVQQAPTQQVMPMQSQPAGEKKFVYPGQPDGLKLEDFQKVVGTYAQSMPRGNPLKNWEQGELAGMQVLQCFGNYRGDMDCIKCPLRRYCLQY